MKKIGLLALALTAVLASGAHAAAGTNWFGVNGGLGFPFGDFSDVASTGFNLGITGDHMVSPQLGFGGEISWHVFGGTDDLEKSLSASAGVPVDVTTRVLPFSAHVQYLLPAGPQVAPFLKGGIGLYNLKTKVDAGPLGTSDDSRTKFGFHIGGGVNFKKTEKIAYGVEALYNYIATDGNAATLLTLRGQLLFGFPGGSGK